MRGYLFHLCGGFSGDYALKIKGVCVCVCVYQTPRQQQNVIPQTVAWLMCVRRGRCYETNLQQPGVDSVYSPQTTREVTIQNVTPLKYCGKQYKSLGQNEMY